MAGYASRIDDLIVEELDDGLLIYDTRSHQAHWLDASTASVWQACREGGTDIEIARRAGVDPSSCALALERLADIGLVYAAEISGVSRREVLRTAAKVGVAGVAAAPIVTAVIPVAATHASTGSTGGGTPPTLRTVTYTIQSGTNDGQGPNGGYQDPTLDGTPEPSNQTSVDRSSWITAVNTNAGYPWAWAILPNSGWIDNPTDGGYGTFYFRPTGGLSIPPGAQNAKIQGQFLSDNEGWAYLGSTVIGDGSLNQFSTPTSFSANLSPGPNDFYFQVQNDGGPGGLDYVATISYDI